MKIKFIENYAGWLITEDKMQDPGETDTLVHWAFFKEYNWFDPMGETIKETKFLIDIRNKQLEQFKEAQKEGAKGTENHLKQVCQKLGIDFKEFLLLAAPPHQVN